MGLQNIGAGMILVGAIWSIVSLFGIMPEILTPGALIIATVGILIVAYDYDE